MEMISTVCTATYVVWSQTLVTIYTDGDHRTHDLTEMVTSTQARNTCSHENDVLASTVFIVSVQHWKGV